MLLVLVLPARKPCLSRLARCHPHKRAFPFQLLEVRLRPSLESRQPYLLLVLLVLRVPLPHLVLVLPEDLLLLYLACLCLRACPYLQAPPLLRTAGPCLLACRHRPCQEEDCRHRLLRRRP